MINCLRQARVRLLLAEIHRVCETAGSPILSMRLVPLNTPASKIATADTYTSLDRLEQNTINTVIWIQKPTEGKL
jgi:hypothetical protein